MNIRGTEARLNSMMIDGERIPAPDPLLRQVALDVIPRLFQTIEVSKALTPDMDADAIGGSVNLVMKPAPESCGSSARWAVATTRCCPVGVHADAVQRAREKGQAILKRDFSASHRRSTCRCRRRCRGISACIWMSLTSTMRCFGTTKGVPDSGPSGRALSLVGAGRRQGDVLNGSIADSTYLPNDCRRGAPVVAAATAAPERAPKLVVLLMVDQFWRRLRRSLSHAVESGAGSGS